jgi:hypothetical protein
MASIMQTDRLRLPRACADRTASRAQTTMTCAALGSERYFQLDLASVRDVRYTAVFAPA